MPRQAKFDKIVVARLEIEALALSPTIRVVAAYVDSLTGNTFGSGVFSTGFSPEAMELLQQLRERLALDIENTVFIGDGPVMGMAGSVDATPGISVPGGSVVPTGLGEDLLNEQGLPGDRDRSLTT